MKFFVHILKWKHKSEWHTWNDMLLIIEKQLIRTININLGDLDLQWRKYCFHFNVGERMLLSKMFMFILKKSLFIKILKIGTVWTSASKMMKETHFFLFLLLCTCRNPGYFINKTNQRRFWKKRDRLGMSGPKDQCSVSSLGFLFASYISQTWDRRSWQLENTIGHCKKKHQQNFSVSSQRAREKRQK